MDKKPTKVEIKRISGAIKRSKRKFLSLDALSRLVGLYPDVLGNKLSYFEPMVMMDFSLNMKDLLPALEKYLEEPSSVAKPKTKARRPSVSKKELAKYSSITDFVYKRMTTVGGLVDTSCQLSAEDLSVLRKLIDNEEKKQNKKVNAKKGKK